MGFSCTIKSGDKDLTKYQGGVINSQLLDLGPNNTGATEAPYSVSDFRQVVKNCRYGTQLNAAAQDCFRELQRMVLENLQALTPPKHCETCLCDNPEIIPKWWSADALRALLAIDACTITYVQGGY